LQLGHEGAFFISGPAVAISDAPEELCGAKRLCYFARPGAASARPWGGRALLLRKPGGAIDCMSDDMSARAHSQTWRGGTAALALLALTALGGCAGPMDPQGPVASALRTILLNSLGIMLAIVIPTIIATLGMAYWYRASNTRATYLPNWEYSGRLEMIVWSIPAMTVLLLAGIGWISSHDLDPRRPLPGPAKPLPVQVVSLDWKWLFIYPEQGVASVNQLTIPAATPISFQLTSQGVMNSFFVPQLGSQIYTMARMVTQLQLQADKPGSFAGLSAQFSGDGFADMHFVVDAVPPDQFNAWVAKTRGTGGTLDAAAYAELVHPSTAVAPFTFRAVTPGLFQTIVNPDGPSQLSAAAMCGED
jgi:cytochrome o ubiquinol oxidase subunit II